MEDNITRKTVWSLLTLVLLTCHWKFVTGKFSNVLTVSEVDQALRGYVATTAFGKITDITRMLNDSSSMCSAKLEEETIRCVKCMSRCNSDTKSLEEAPDQSEKLRVLIYYAYVLTVSSTEVMISKASKAVERFGKDSSEYIQTVGKTAEILGQAILKNGNKLFKSTGKKLKKLGKKLEDVSKELLKKGAEGLTHASKQVTTGIKDTLEGIKKTTKPLIKETVKILKKVGTVVGKAVKNLGNGISKSLSNTAKSLGGAVRRILQKRLPRISYRLPRVQLPRVQLPRVRLPRVSFRAPRVRIGRGGWGKKRDLKKAVRETVCSCLMCVPLQDGVSDTEKAKKVCGSSYFSDQNKLVMDFNDLHAMHEFAFNNQLVKKIFTDKKSVEYIEEEFVNDGYYLTDSGITVSAPNGKELYLKMTIGMPFVALTPLNTTEIARIDGPNVFKLLKMNV